MIARDKINELLESEEMVIAAARDEVTVDWRAHEASVRATVYRNVLKIVDGCCGACGACRSGGDGVSGE